ncbi:MAG: hypothetical protein MNSN_02000 [Minisyncoccus archaeiphilus]|jgi:hypothetical protein|uniref:hypothetical protein n=1 Tax=Minisyncoccus archaeiphilus TaxID=3238481 RepID=UPI002B188BD3|nr:MAG: hypothetical protein MNSN_02000 [Candidatus Parcubacteria bacterium]
MITKELLDYIIYQLTHGQDWEKVKQDLLANGWTIDILSEAYETIRSDRPDLNLMSVSQPQAIASAENVEEGVIIGINPEDRAKVSDISVDDVVFKEVGSQESVNSVIADQVPADALTMSSVSIEETEPVGQSKDKYLIDTGAVQESGAMEPKKAISINVTKVDPGPRAVKESVNKEVAPSKDAGAVINPQAVQEQAIEPKKKKSSPIGLIIFLVIILVLAGGSAFAYFNYFAPEKVAAKVMQNLRNTNAADFAGKLTVNLSLSEKAKEDARESVSLMGGEDIEKILANPLNIGIDMEGRFDFRDDADKMLDSSLTLSTVSDEKNYAISFGQKLYSNSFYLNIKDISIPESDKITPEIREYFGKWIRVLKPVDGEKTISEMITKSDGGSNNSSAKGINFSLIGIENAEDTYCFKTKITFDKQLLKESMLEEFKAQGEEEEVIKEFNESYDEQFDQYLAKMDIVVWTGIMDSNLYKVNVSYSDMVEFGDLSVIMSLEIDNHNDIIAIVPPDGHIEAEELLGMWLTLAVPEKPGSFDDNEIRSAMEQARVVAEKYKTDNGNYNGLEFSNDMNRVINEDINKWGGSAAVFANTSDKYCLSKRLVNEPNNWCIDSSSFVGVGECNKSEVKCIVSVDVPSAPVETPVTPVEPVAPVVQPTTDPADIHAEKKDLINQLKVLLEDQKKNKGTYLGVVSSQKGIALVKDINNNEDVNVIVIKTSKEKFCAMKKFGDGTYYCVDNSGFSGAGEDCDEKAFLCKAEVVKEPETVKTEAVKEPETVAE